jgi:hypothetical protein
LFNRII